MKKDAPNCSAPQGLPHGRTPSWISFDHSKACMPTKDAPRRAVANISAAVFFRSRRYPKLTAIAIVPLLLMRTKVMIAIRISGIDWPAIVSANTSLAFGHGTVVDDRTVMRSEERRVGKECVSTCRSRGVA